ncbi:pyridoxal phosphate-dependent transferase [Aspergillus transmontanensis]|uniref:Pyridoxal phosphate-dependent transferase n=1 Tax=Aspergillus transmontanensis TaxID=1034304 RepID=A0A5N6VHW6_9EURO|nr:pyridoxal phosphate-dependent transferase [Aspergillus transmontanensis]
MTAVWGRMRAPQALPEISIATKAVHTGDFVSTHRAVAPGMHMVVNYRYARDPERFAPNHNRLEVILRILFGGELITYSTVLSTFHAMMILLNPKRILIGGGYHGYHGLIDVLNKLTGVQKFDLSDLERLGPGDVVHVETPLNPTGKACNLAYYSAKAHERGAFLSVEATFAPPQLQDPLRFDAHIVVHSGTKYVGAHSDMLCGILTLHAERKVLGNVMCSLEGWRGIQSVRTIHLRVMRQAETDKKMIQWLYEEMQNPNTVVAKVLDKVQDASIEHEALKGAWLQKQMPGGFGLVVYVFQNVTSLGGVESLMEWRDMSDAICDKRLLWISCGV